jgi:hypothetical protein
MRSQLLAAALFAATGFSAASAQQERPVLAAQRAATPPVIDGRLDDEAWRHAQPASGFVQLRPNAGRPATHETEARVTYDGVAVYVALRMYDSAPDSIAAELRRRDDTGGYSDWVHVSIGSYRDERTAFRFSVNPRGVQADAFLYDDTRTDGSWDAVWQSATRIDSLGWTAELRIPLSQLRYSPPRAGEQDYAWEINFHRDVARLDESSSWSPIPPDAGRHVSLFGRLTGLADLSGARRLELVPYTSGSLRHSPVDADDPFRSRNQPDGALGADLRYGVTSNLTLTATLNPDFGQVEADPSEVNLTAFETFFGERRPFFAEGLDVFDFRIIPRGAGSEQLLYSRRIGRRPQRGIRTPPGGFQDAPEATRILGAAKLTGKTQSGWTVGALGALTAQEEARLDTAGVRWREPVEPLTGVMAGRALRSFRGGQSALGGMVTAVERRIDDDGLSFLRSSAYVAGVDARHRFGDGRYEATLFAAGSRVEGSPEAMLRTQLSSARYYQRPDAEHLEVDPGATSLTGWSSMATVASVTGKSRWWLGLSNRSPGFEVNDAGFQVGADERWAALVLSHNEHEAGRVFRRWGGNLLLAPIWTTAWERTATFYELSLNGQLRNFYGGSLSVARGGEGLNVKGLRGGPAIVEPPTTNAALNVYTDRRRKLSVSGGGWAGMQEQSGSRWGGASAAAELRAGTRMSLQLASNFMTTSSAAQWVNAVGGYYLFGGLEQRTASMTTRLSLTASPTLSFQFYAQPFVSAQGYGPFLYVTDPRGARHEDRFAPIPESALTLDESNSYHADLDGDGTADVSFRNPDFRVREVRSNAVLRWEYRPGSALFVVWSHGRGDFLPDGRLRLGRDARDLLRDRPTHVLLVKATYWLQL